MEHTPYTDNIEYIQDELRRLDLLLHIHLRKKMNRHPQSRQEPFNGHFLTDEAAFRLLEPDRVYPNDIQAEREDIVWDYVLAERKLGEVIAERRQASLKAGVPLTLPALSRAFRLTAIEEFCLLICAAIEIDSKYELLYAYLQGGLTRKGASIDLIGKLLGDDLRDRIATRRLFEPQSGLMKYGLIRFAENEDASASMLSYHLQADPGIVAYLLGTGDSDARLEPFVHVSIPDDREVERDEFGTDERFVTRVKEFARRGGAGEESAAFYLYGPYGSGKTALAEAVCRELGHPLLIADIAAMRESPHSPETLLFLLFRESVLQRAALCLQHVDILFGPEQPNPALLSRLIGLMRLFPALTFLLGSRPWTSAEHRRSRSFIELEMPVLKRQERAAVWRHYGQSYHVTDDSLIEIMADKYRFTAGQIRDVLHEASLLASWRSPMQKRIGRDELEAACSRHVHHRLHLLADKLTPSGGWDNLILTEDQRLRLEEVVQQGKYRSLVYREWGFDRKLARGKGLSVLFHGPPGTGKTTAAEVLAGELRLDLYRIDLSQIVSKYIGETEKNLQQVFREARDSYAVLFFDEADALFSKRTEVKDSHDRHANTEIAYLLQQMEEYDGVTILATNLHSNLDEAFVRRIRFSIEFPLPDDGQRLQIWQSMLPEEAPVGEDVDLPFLANAFKLAGGNIKNIVLSAAFLAAAQAGPIEMKHLVHAAKRELEKIGKLWRTEDFGPYGRFLS